MRAWVGIGLLALAGCSAGKREATSLVTAVDRFHAAENDEKPAAAEGVNQVPCSVDEVCAAKKLCLSAVDPMARGLRLKAEVQRGIDALQNKQLSPEDEAARALPQRLDEASRLLDEGYRAMPACDARLLELRRKYDL